MFIPPDPQRFVPASGPLPPAGELMDCLDPAVCPGYAEAAALMDAVGLAPSRAEGLAALGMSEDALRDAEAVFDFYERIGSAAVQRFVERFVAKVAITRDPDRRGTPRPTRA